MIGNESWLVPHKVYGPGDEMRVKGLVLGARYLLSLMRGHFQDRLDSGRYRFLEVMELPPVLQEARVVGIIMMHMPPAVEIFFEHPSFEPVPLGQHPPRIDYELRAVGLKYVGESQDHNYGEYEVEPQQLDITRLPIDPAWLLAGLRKLGITTASKGCDGTHVLSATGLATELAEALSTRTHAAFSPGKGAGAQEGAR